MAIEQTLELEPTERTTTSSSGVVRAAMIIAMGNVASRILGLARGTVIAYLFGATGFVSAFYVAATLVQQLYDFLVGGMTSAALIPVFSDLDQKDRSELWRVASIVINGLALILAFVVVLLELLAPQITAILGGGYDPSLQATVTEMIRLILPAVFFLGLSGVVSGLLYSLRRFSYPAFTTAAYNLGIVVVAFALTPLLGISSLLLGVIVGSLLQTLLLLPGLRDMRYRPSLDFAHPAFRRVLSMYVPVLGGLTVAQIGIAIDRNLVSTTGAQSLAWMQNATQLVQFPLGLVATAIAVAILPELSRIASQSESPQADQFVKTLGFGINLVLLLILPATVGLFVLAQPITALLFQHGAFTALDTFWTSTALQFYLIGLPFAAIDQPLVFAFYARKDTVTPNLVAFLGVAIYVIVALTLREPLGVVGLVIANSAQLTGHALAMLWLANRKLGGLNSMGTLPLLLKLLLVSIVLGIVAFFARELTDTTWLQVLLPTALAGFVYLALLKLLRIRELDDLWHAVYARYKALT